MTADELKSKLHYDPETGVFVWVKSPGRGGRGIQSGDCAGSVVKCYRGTEYIQIGMDRRKYFAHRLAWLYMTGEMPLLRVVHLNGNGTDNRWINIAHESHRDTQIRMIHGRMHETKRASEYPGVRKSGNRFEARIKAKGKYVYVGTFDTPETAHAARILAKRNM